MPALEVHIINLIGHSKSCKLSELLPENYYGRSELKLSDLPNDINYIILTNRSVWRDDKRFWYINDKFKVLTTTYLNSDEKYYYLTHTNMFSILTMLRVQRDDIGVLNITNPDWFTCMCEKYKMIDENETPVGAYGKIIKIPEVKSKTELETGQETSTKFSWNVETSGKLIKVPDGAISVKVNVHIAENPDDSDVYFLLSDGYIQLLDVDDMRHIRLKDIQTPYTWIGLPKNTVYIYCNTTFRYKFSYTSKNIYRGLPSRGPILPQNYTGIKDGKTIELIYSEEKKSHEPKLDGTYVLILGQS